LLATRAAGLAAVDGLTSKPHKSLDSTPGAESA
jgi:hypothetical protein